MLAFAFVCLVSQAYIAQQKIMNDTEKLLFDSANRERAASGFPLLTWDELWRVPPASWLRWRMHGEQRTRAFLAALKASLASGRIQHLEKGGSLIGASRKDEGGGLFSGRKPRGVATSFGFTQHKASSPGALLELSKQTGSNDSRPEKSASLPTVPSSAHRARINAQMESLL